MEDLFLFVKESTAYDTMIDAIFHDVSSCPWFQQVTEHELRDRWQQLLISKKGQKYTFGKLNWLLKGEYSWINKVEKCADQFRHIYVIFVDLSFVFHRPPVELIRKLKNKVQNITLVLYYFDMVNRPACDYSNALREQGVFDLVYSFDKNDAQKYGLIFWRTPYSRIAHPESSNQYCDLYYCAKLKERRKYISELLASSVGKCSVRMDLVLNKNENIEGCNLDSVNLYQRGHNLPYHEVLRRTLCSNCILDISLPNQSGVSFRVYEAVVYNKKLLTNNPAILQFEYYNNKYMRYYQSTDQIDWDWVRKAEKVDYHYQGDYSPKRWLDDIRRRSKQQSSNV